MFDLIVIGGGVSGVAAAVSSARQGCNVLIIEKNTFLGGSATGALVTPMMKNTFLDETGLNTSFYKELLGRLRETSDSAVFKDGNPGWFNPEILKCVFDDICEENNIHILFDAVVTNVRKKNNKITSIECISTGIKQSYKAKYYVDATGNADVASMLGCDFEIGHDNINQSMTLRFNMANIDLKTFAQFLENTDPDSGVSQATYLENGEILLSTAYTWDDKDWKLKSLFEKAIKENVLREEDTAYFQIFSIPGQSGVVSFNCPRIYSGDNSYNPLDIEDTSKALIIARQQIRRLAYFCKKYFPGFENAFIVQIAPMLGVRDSRRVECKYKLTEQDILEAKKFKHPVARSNYPIDIHSKEKNQGGLSFLKEGEYYEIPLEVMLPKNIANLLVTGRAVCATFNAQASLRIQPTCISMGEAIGKYVANTIKG